MVESFANSVEDKLIDSLQFKLKEGASYVTDRKSVTYHASGSNIYTPQNGTKLIKLQLTGDNWLDPSTLRVQFTLTNNATGPGQKLRPIAGPWAFFRRIRLLAGGVVCEDIDYANRVTQMMHILQSEGSRRNDFCEGFGEEMSVFDGLKEYKNAKNWHGIKHGQSQTVLFKPLLGLFMQNKFLPLKKMNGLTLELELVDDFSTPIVTPYTGTAIPTTTEVDEWFTINNTSAVWSITNPQIKCDLITLDNGLQNSYDAHLLQGNAFPINYNTFITQCQTVIGNNGNGQQKMNLTVSRAITRLKSVFITLDKDIVFENTHMKHKPRKDWNDFYSPMYNYSIENDDGVSYDQRGEFEFSMAIGSKRFPDYPITSHQESFYQLRKCLGVQSSPVHSFDITVNEYRSDKMVIGIDCEKLLEAGFTGYNTRAGDLLSISFAHKDTNDDNFATKMYITLQSDNVLEIRDGGINVYD